MKSFLFLTLIMMIVGGAATAAPLPSEVMEGSFVKELSSEREGQNSTQEEEKVKRDFKFSEKADWKRGELDVPYLKLNALRFTNRARCAADAEKPTRSFYVLVDSLNVAKGAYRLALATGQDRNFVSRHAVERFRYSSLKLANYIAQKLLKGELPLLSSDNRERAKGQELYRKITEACRLDGYCPELDEYLSKIWNYPRGKDKAQIHWSEVDHFSEDDFIKTSDISLENKAPALACYYLKKHSPLQGHLDAVIPDKTGLTMMAQSVIDQNKLLASCDDMDAQQSIEFASYQIDLKNLNAKAWEAKGFDFFHSLRLYFSWAWRFAPEISSFTYPFQNYFKSVHLEDSVMFFSNGCEGMTRPSCDTTFINDQSLRNFATKEFTRNDSKFDNLLYLPQGAAQGMIDNPTPEVNKDILDLNKFETMDDWMKNFRENVRKSRGIIKGRLIRSLTSLDLLIKNVKPAQIMADLEAFKGSKELPYVLGDREPELLKKHQIYALCAEAFIASDDVLSFLRKDLSLLQNIKTLDPLFERFSDQDMATFYKYYEGLFTEVRSFCKTLESENYWGNDFNMDKTLFAPWYKESIYKNSIPPASPEMIQTVGVPLLAYNFFETSQGADQVVCWDGIDCSRKVLESIINLYSVAQYKELYFPNAQNVQTPDLANPYAERVACKVYDPWWQTKRAFFHVLSNAAAAGVSAVNPTPFFLTVDLKPNTVVSFNRLVEDGTIKLEPQFDKNKVMTTMGADLGKWLGVPCSVSVSNYANTKVPTRTYFTGLTIEACKSQTTSGATVINGSEIEKNPNQASSACLSCSLNFAKIIENGYPIPSTLPWIQSSFYLLRGSILFFKEMRDPVNVPHRYEVNPNYVLETFRRYGEIPNNCVKRLKEGKPCMENRCEQALADLFQEEWGTSIKGIELKMDHADVNVSQCAQNIKVKNLRHFLNLFCKKELSQSQVDLGSCAPVRKGMNHEIR